MPSKNKASMHTNKRTESCSAELPEKVNPKKQLYSSVNQPCKTEKKCHSRQRWRGYNTLSHTFCRVLVLKLKSSCYLAGFLQLSASFPGLREHGADNALGTDVSSCLGVRNSTVRLIRMI